MPLSLQEIADRLEIQDLIFHYADIIDSKNFDELRSVFTSDAYIDYSETGGAVGNIDEIIAFLHAAMKKFPNTQHLNANIQIDVDKDTATGRVMCFNPMEMAVAQGTHTFMLGIWYIDRYVRCAEGWRIKERVEQHSWQFNFPESIDKNWQTDNS